MEKKKESNGFLYFSVITLNLASFSIGMAFAWSSPSIPRLTGLVDPEHNPLPQALTAGETSWVTSLVALGATCSPLPAALCSDRYGRKRALAGFLAPIIVAFLMLAFAKHVTLYYVARFMAGFSVGGVYTVLPIYIGEICPRENRGALSCFLILILSLGSLFMYAMGPYVTIQIASLLAIIAPLVFFSTVLPVVPESPYFLVASNRRGDALRSLAKLRSAAELTVCEKELAEITQTVEESFLDKVSILDMFRSPVLLKSMMIMMGLVTFQQFSGVNCILLYLQTIFAASNGESNTDNSLAPEIGSIIIGVTQFLAAIVTSAFVDRLGRRFLMILSAVGSMVSLVTLGIFFYLLDNDYDVTTLSFLPVTSLIVFMLSYTFGFGPIPFTILGEIFPPNVKATASTVTITLCLALAYVNTMSFPYMVETLGNAISFWFYGVCCFLAVFYFYFLLPETKGKSLQEIQSMLNKKNVSH